MANEIEIRITVHDGTGKGLAEAKREAKKAGDDIADTLTRAGEKAGDGLKRGIDGRLRDAKGRFAKAGEDAGDGFGKGFGDRLGNGKSKGLFGRLFDGLMDQVSNFADAAGKSLAQIFPGLAGLASTTVATGGVNLLVGALVALAAAAIGVAAALVVLAPALYLIGGAFGAATTAGVGLSSVLGTLVVGLGGLGDAWSAYGQQSTGGGRSAADAAHQVKMATLGLADAQREALDAQEALSRARKSEQERLEDLARSVAGARLDEEGAVLAVQRAEQRLREARRGGNALDIKEAELAYRQALQTLAEVQDRVGDLAEEQEEANQKGIEGSDQVQAALRRQELAQRQLEQATYALAQAQRGAGGGVNKFAEAMAALSPNARAFMTTLFQLRDRFADIKRATQDRLFEGLDKAIERLANRSFPTLKTILGETATALNGVVKGAFEALGKPEFLTNITTATRGFNSWLDRLGSTTVPKLIDTLGRLAAKSVPFFEAVGDLISDIVEDFADWVAEADKTGDLDTFFKDAAQSLRDIRDIGGLAFKIIGQVVDILFEPSKRESDTFLGGVKEGLQGVSDWLSDPKNKQQIQDWISDIQDFGDKIGETVDKVINLVNTTDKWTTRLDKFVGFFTGLPGRIKNAAKGMWDGISEAFRAQLNKIVGWWNGLEFRWPSFTIFGQTFGGGSWGTPNIDYFDHGGIVGGRLAAVAERSRELIDLPGGGQLLALPQGSMVHPSGATERMLGGGGAAQVLLGFDERAGTDLEALLIKIFKRYIRTKGGTGPNSVQIALGQKTN